MDLISCSTVYIATLNLPDTLNFELAEEDVARLSSGRQLIPSRTRRRSLPVPNLIESLWKSTPSGPPSASGSPTSEFHSAGGGQGNRRDIFTTGPGGLAAHETDSAGRRLLNQPPSRAAYPTPPLIDMDVSQINYGPGSSPPRPRKRGVTINDKIFSDAKWTTEKQQFGVNGGLINAVISAQNAGALKDYKWIGTLGMVFLSLLSSAKDSLPMR